jgi:polyketide cyclase/dehydrase/lipid transport protein
MKAFTLTRSLAAHPDRVWAIIGDPGSSPGPGVDVTVERPGSADGAGLVRVVMLGRNRVREEIASVGPGYTLSYRMLSGAPVRDYTGSVVLDESSDGGTLVRWSVSFRPVVPGTGPLVSALTKRSLKRVLDVIDARTRTST